MLAMYWLNVDKPTGTATIHLETSRDPQCQPLEKPLRYGYWRRFITEPAAKAHASAMGMTSRFCRMCASERVE